MLKLCLFGDCVDLNRNRTTFFSHYWISIFITGTRAYFFLAWKCDWTDKGEYSIIFCLWRRGQYACFLFKFIRWVMREVMSIVCLTWTEMRLFSFYLSFLSATVQLPVRRITLTINWMGRGESAPFYIFACSSYNSCTIFTRFGDFS